MKNLTIRLFSILAICSIYFGLPQAAPSGRPRLLQTRLESLAPARAKDCGHVPKDAAAIVVTCVHDAIKTKTVFFASFTQQGIDSEVIFGLALSKSGTVVQVWFDSDFSGGGCKNCAEVSAPVNCIDPQFDVTGTHVRIVCR